MDKGQTIQWPKGKGQGQTMIYKTLHRKLKKGQTIQWPKEKGQPTIYKT